MITSGLERMNKFDDFVTGDDTPWPIMADAYTISGNIIASKKARQKSTYNFANRVWPLKAMSDVALDNRMVLFGVTDFCRLLARQTTYIDVMASKEYMDRSHSYGGPLHFPEHLWMRVINEYNGLLPIKIESLPDGSTFWPGEPVIQVTSLDDGFGEIAAHIEGVMVGMVSVATARATLTRHWLERMRDAVRAYNPGLDEQTVLGRAQWMIHDFGMRASSCLQESNILGRAHLLSFNGTDTFNAGFTAWEQGASHPVGTSILALAHRIVQGYESEYEAYNSIYNASDPGIGSYVADCYDFARAVTNCLVPLAKQGQNIVVARPDSGDYLDNVLFVVKTAINNGLYTTREDGRKVPTTLRFIQGDSMNPDKVMKCIKAVAALGCDPTAWGIFGVGGYLRNTPNRDVLSSAYKLSAMGHDDQWVIKLSDTPAKLSIPGPSVLLRGKNLRYAETVCFANEVSRYGDNFKPAYVTYYNGDGTKTCRSGIDCFGDVCFESFDTIRQRAIEEFDSHANVEIDRHNPFSPEIRKCQEWMLDRYGKKS